MVLEKMKEPPCKHLHFYRQKVRFLTCIRVKERICDRQCEKKIPTRDGLKPRRRKFASRAVNEINL